jgi:hypothetical protein
MTPSDCRLRTPPDDAVRRFAAWNRIPQTGPLFRDRRLHLFQDLSGVLCCIPSPAWLEFAGDDDLVFAAYNDGAAYGELLVVGDGGIVREFRDG